MLRTIGLACLLALRDYARERLLSACAILGLAAVLAPLLVLQGVKFGVVGTLTERLRKDPLTLEITPVSSGHYDTAWLQGMANHPDVSFVIARTRNIAATMDLLPPNQNNATSSGTASGQQGQANLLPRQGLQQRGIVVSLEPTAAGDPLLELHVGTIRPGGGNPAGMVLSATAAEKLGVGPGSLLKGRVGRRHHGREEQAGLELAVLAVLPLAAQQKDVAYVPLDLLEATEDYRDGRAVPSLGWPGDPPPAGGRMYPGFRLHAASLDAVERLRQGFAELGIEVYTRAEEIAQVSLLSDALTTIFGLIVMAAVAGFLASTFSATLAAVRRKARILGLLRLTGFTTPALLLYPLVQALFTALLGTGLAAGIYCLVATCINQVFAGSLNGMEQICRLLPSHFLLALGLAALLSLVAALGPAIVATRVQPPEVLRDE